MSKLTKKSREKYYKKNLENRQHYISRITKTLYYAKFPQQDGLSLPVTELASELFSEAHRGRSLDRLHCDDAATISRNACVSPCSLVIALLYLERLKKTNPDYLERTASSDVFLVSLMVSCKFLYDDGEDDEVFIDQWADSIGTSIKRLVQLEKEFLKAIDWEIFVNELSFWKKLNEVEAALARRQGTTRGFFTYTELESLLASIDLKNLIQSIVALSAILIASYCAAVITLFVSVVIVSHIPGACLQQRKIEAQPNNSLVPIIDDAIQTELVEKTVLPASAVLKTGIFLSFLKPYCNKSENVQEGSWDWWNVPTLAWLAETTTITEKTDKMNFDFFNFRYLYDSFVALKSWDFGDPGRVTKTVVQDYVENSWRVGWSNPVGYGLDLEHYIQNVKS